MILFGKPGERTCRGCGCTDSNACVVNGIACSWILLDVHTPTGVCTVCALDLDYDPAALATIGFEPEPMAVGARR
jgi:hypothetical protein